MSAAAPRLALSPDRCDSCGRCVPVCSHGALRVGGGLIYVDTSACDGCLACARVCTRGAIAVRPAGQPSAVRGPSGDVRVVVGSRSEAKALREQAQQTERAREKRAAEALRNARHKERLDAVSVHDASEGRVAWTVWDAATVLFVMSVSLIATRSITASHAVSLMPVEGRAVVRAGVLVGFFGVQMAALTLLARRHGSRLVTAFGLGALGRSRGAVTATAALVAAFTLGTRAVSYGWGVLARAVGWSPPDSGALTAVFGSGGAGLALAVIALVVLGPFAEELAFRGVVLRALGRSLGPWTAIVVTAGVFAAYHATAWTFVPLMALGIAAGWLAWSRRSLWGAIALHALYNGVVVVAVYWLAR